MSKGPLPHDAVIVVRAMLNERLALACKHLERPGMPEWEANLARGRIAELRHLIEWISPPITPPPGRLSEPPNY